MGFFGNIFQNMKKIKIGFVLVLLFTLFFGGFLNINFSSAMMPLTVDSFSPSDDNTYVASSSNLIITFNQAAAADVGGVYIKRLADNSIFEYVPAASTTINSAVVTIDLASDLENDTQYYVQIDSTAFKKLIGIGSYDGIIDRTTWSFHAKNELFKTEMVKNINNYNFNSSPGNFVATSGLVFFYALEWEGAYKSLWVTDGTESGTIKLKDRVSLDEQDHSNSNKIAAFNGEVYFPVISAAGVYELWKTNGTDVGTVRVKSIGNNLPPTRFVVGSSSLMYFVAGTAANGTELWKTDGTSNGTIMLGDIDSGSGSSDPSFLTMANGLLFFSADSGAAGRELWKSNGKTAGTVLVRDIASGSSGPAHLKALGNIVFFSADSNTSAGRELWKSDGTSGGTVQVANINTGSYGNSNPVYLTTMKNRLFFVADNGSANGQELWFSNGNTSGTALVKDINVGSAGSLIENFVVTNQGASSTLFFWASSSGNGLDLWSSNGTTSGTSLVKNIAPGASNAVNSFYSSDYYPLPPDMAVVGNTVYFSATDGINGFQLWKSNGTASGTSLVKQINANASASPAKFYTSGSVFYFQASDGTANGLELWKSDGTADGTVMVKNISTGSYGSEPENFKIFNNELYFTADGTARIKNFSSNIDPDAELNVPNPDSNDISGRQIWKTDGTPSGTVMVDSVGLPDKNFLNFATTSVGLFFSLYYSDPDSGEVYGLWKVNSGPSNTVMLKNLPIGEYGAETVDFGVLNDRLYFSAGGAQGVELWSTDGTVVGTELLKDIALGADSSSPGGFSKMGANLYFWANDRVNGSEFWKTDGTEVNTVMVKDLNGDTSSSSPRGITTVGNQVFFYDSSLFDIWKSDGSTSGTRFVKSLGVGSYLTIPEGFLRLNDSELFFIAYPFDDDEIWKSNGTTIGTGKFYDVFPGSVGEITSLKNIDDKIYFSASTNGDMDTTWVTNGMATGTLMLTSYDRGVCGCSTQPAPNEFWKFGGSVYFTAKNPLSGYEIFRTDGTATGTVMMSDIYSGLGDSCSLNYIDLNGYLYFSATNGIDGKELWRAYLVEPPLASTSATVSGLSTTSATIGGSLNSLGKAGSVERGVVYATTSNPTTANSKISQEGISSTGSFSSSITGLSCSTEYHYRAYAKNKAGITYGSDLTFTTSACPCPVISNVATYSPYPTCSPATCNAGYHISGSSCVIDGGGGGSSGSGGGSGSAFNLNADSSLTVAPSQGGSINKIFLDNNFVQLTVPQNSVSSPTTFKVAELSLTSGNLPAGSSSAVLIGGQAFSITAANASGQAISSFSRPLTATIKIPSMPSSAANLGLYYFDEKSQKWILIQGAVFDVGSKTVTFTTDHLTVFAIFNFIGIRPIMAVETSEKISAVPLLAAPVISEADNIVNRYYPLLNIKLEEQLSSKAATLSGFGSLSEKERDAIIKFSAYGTPSTKVLGAGERLGVVNSYLSAFGHLPKTVADFNDIIKISTGRWPTVSNQEAIARAQSSFEKIYLRHPDMNQPNDNAAVTIMAYGLRSANRNLKSEKAAIKIYKAIFKKAPTAAIDWDTVRTIAYSGAKR